MKIYTRKGDNGTTALYGGTRLPKHHIRISSYGEVDELNAWIGMLRDQIEDVHFSEVLLKIQHDLFTLGAMLATDPEKAKMKSGKDRLNITLIENRDIEYLEAEIDKMDASLPAMTHFILPGGHPIVSSCHISRTVCRRAERMCSLLQENEEVHDTVLPYINRLSDFLFVLGRKLTEQLQAQEIKWIPEKKD